MQFDATYKNIYAHPFMIREALRLLLPAHPGGGALLDALDLSTLRRTSEQSVSRRNRRRARDMVWEVAFGKRQGGTTGDQPRRPRWLHLLVFIEFQRRPDFLMALRIRAYIDDFLLERWKGRHFGKSDRLTPSLAVVIHAGGRWTAARRVADLVAPPTDAGAADAARLPAIRSADMLAGDGYIALDAELLQATGDGGNNAAWLLAALENPTPEQVGAWVARLRARLDAPELAHLREVLFAYVEAIVKQSTGFAMGVGDMAEVDALHDRGHVEESIEARRRMWQEKYRKELEQEARERGWSEGWNKGRKEGRKEGIKEGREEGRMKAREESLARQRDVLSRQANRRFGPAAGDALAAAISGVGDLARLDAIADLIVDCRDGRELLRRMAE